MTSYLNSLNSLEAITFVAHDGKDLKRSNVRKNTRMIMFHLYLFSFDFITPQLLESYFDVGVRFFIVCTISLLIHSLVITVSLPHYENTLFIFQFESVKLASKTHVYYLITHSNYGIRLRQRRII